MKAFFVSLALMAAVSLAAFADTTTQDKVKQDAQPYLSQAQQQGQQYSQDYEERNVASVGNAATDRFNRYKQRIDAQAAVVAQEKAKLDEIVGAGRVAKPSDLSNYQKAIDEYNSRVKELDAWLKSN